VKIDFTSGNSHL